MTTYKFCSFATNSFKTKQERQLQHLLHTANIPFEYVAFNIEFINHLNLQEIDSRIINQKKGFGLWFWKPLIILEVMQASLEGDVIIYADSGDLVNGLLLNEIDNYNEQKGGKWNSILLSGNFEHRYWTHSKCFQLMGCDLERYTRTENIQIEAGVQVWRKTEFSERVLKEYCNWCNVYDVIADNDEKLLGFREHRYDQSILTNLMIKYGLTESRDVKLFDMRSFVVCNKD